MSKYRLNYYTSVDDEIRPMVVKAVKLTERVNRFIAETCGQAIMRGSDLTTGDFFKMIGDSVTLMDDMAEFLVEYTEWENQQLGDISNEVRECKNQNKEILSKLEILLERRKD